MPKFKVTFLVLSSIALFSVSRPVAFAQIVDRQPAPPLPIEGNDCEGTTFGCFEVGLPGIPTRQSIDDFVNNPTPILSFINFAVKAVIAILVIIGLISIVVGGYIYMTAAGNGSQVKLAKEIIIAALAGIFISLVSVIILTTVNKYIGSAAKEPALGKPSAGSGSSGDGGTGGGGGSNNNNTPLGDTQSSTNDNPSDSLPENPGTPENSPDGTSGGGSQPDNNPDTGGSGSDVSGPFNRGDYGDSSQWPVTNDSSATIIIEGRPGGDQFFNHMDAGDQPLGTPAHAVNVVEGLRTNPPPGTPRLRIYHRNSQSLSQFLDALDKVGVNRAGIVMQAIP